MKKQTVRIVELLNASPVTITLASERPLSWYQGRRHEEGWSSEAVTWVYHAGQGDSGEILRESTTDGRDCDGRLTATRVCRCKVWRYDFRCSPEVRWVPELGQFFPRWSLVTDPTVYDEFAQGMNY